MTPEETAKLLAACATVDRRKVSALEVLAWHRILGDLRYADCEEALFAHFAESAEWVMPVHIRQRVKAIRRHRVEDAGIPAPPPELRFDPPAYRAWLLEATRRVADGETPEAITAKPLRSLGPA